MTKTTRADALRNREKLIAAATELFAARGTDVSLEAIAKRAGVGIGTLYRHFPTREALVEEAYRHEVEQLTAAAPTLLEQHAADVALAEWMERFVAYAAAKKGMKGALRSERFPDTRERIVAAIAQLLEAGVRAGTLRPDVDADLVWRAMSPVWSIDDEAQIRTLLRLLMDGLRHGA